jgi:type III restriction enzyme
VQNVENVPPAQVGLSREMVTLRKRLGSEAIFEAIFQLPTYRVNAVRQQSPIRRLLRLGRELTRDRLDEAAHAGVMAQVTAQMEVEANALRAAADIERLFHRADHILSNGLHLTYWRQQVIKASRDAAEVKIEVILLAQDNGAMARLEKFAAHEFDLLYEKYKWEIGKLTEARRQIYEKLRLATAKPEFIQWRLPDSIGFRRPPTAPSFDKHLYLDEANAFRAELGGWEAGVLAEELADTAVVGWLRNVERQPWSLEIPYEDGGLVKAMFPDMVIVRQKEDDFRFDILEPHDSSRKDNAAKAVGLAKFVEDHPCSFDRVQLICQRRGADGREHYYPLDMGKEPVRCQVLAVSDNNQLDQIFERKARTRA